jgi:hypothetical protein
MIVLAILGCTSSGEETATPATKDTAHDHHHHDSTADDTGLASFEVTGTVLDEEGAPVSEAMVLVGGREETMAYSAADGFFSLWFTETGYGEPAIVAAKGGYRANGYEFFQPDTPITLSIRSVSPVDNLDYIYEYPGDGVDNMQEDCTHCHTTFVKEFLTSKHAEATRNPLLQDLYAGISHAITDASLCLDLGGTWALGHATGTESDTEEKCYLGGGVLAELNPTCGGPGQLVCDSPSLPAADQPTHFGACADCHAPGINGVAGGRDLHDAAGIAYDLGVHCDTCHKVREVDLSKPPGVGQRLVMGRPSEPGFSAFPWSPVYYGPLIDVPNVIMGGSYQPQFEKAEFCAGCHEQNQPALLPGETLDEDRWPDGLPVHSTFSEWQAGPYGQDATPCQHCHMPANVEAVNAVDITTLDKTSITFGFAREPEDIRQHLFRGPLQGSPRLIDEALYVSIVTDTSADSLSATISVSNVGCGHAVPTGEPMRALVLLVEANSDCGPLDPIDGMTVPDTGGALAQGTAGQDATAAGDSLSWPDAAAVAAPGQVVRVVSPSGDFDDYVGIGVFADLEMRAEDKGLEVLTPVASVTITDVREGILILSEPLELVDGDRLYLGEPWPADFADGEPAQHLAGHAGYAFSRVLLDSDGHRHVPHYRATDMASDNRIGPGRSALTEHVFDLPSGCSPTDVQATVLYRPVSLQLAGQWGWASSDYIIATAEEAL